MRVNSSFFNADVAVEKRSRWGAAQEETMVTDPDSCGATKKQKRRCRSSASSQGLSV